MAIKKNNDKDSIKTVGKLEEVGELPLFVLPKMTIFPDTSIAITSLTNSRISELAGAHKQYSRIAIATYTGNDLEKDKGSKNLKKHLSPVGTEALIVGIVKLERGELGIVFQGKRRFYLKDVKKDSDKNLSAKVQFCTDRPVKMTTSFKAIQESLKTFTLKAVRLNPNIPQETAALLSSTDDFDLMANLIVPFLSLSLEERLELLGTFDRRTRFMKIIKQLSQDVKLFELSSKIQKGVQGDLQENIRRNFLYEQIAAIKKELGDSDDETDEIEELHKSIEKLDLPEATKKVVMKEIDRLEMMTPSAPEYLVSWTFINWIKDLPWSTETGEEKLSLANLSQAKKVIDSSHYGLDKVKERILEYLAVVKHKGHISGQILLLSGPPGVGKTSLARAIAESLGRPFAKIALGGVKDEAEIRGHRKTYIGAMPGKIIQAIKDAGSNQAVVLLDEIDKVGSQSPGLGDLSSALLEVLDPEQNKVFTDHYLSVPFDLSKVIFICTANTSYHIPEPLLDRMDVLNIPGYTPHEKLMITKEHIIPAIRKDFKLTARQFNLSDSLIKLVINHYTREAGVRQLKREFETLGRKVVSSLVHKKSIAGPLKITRSNLIEQLGPPKFLDEPKDRSLMPGVSIGLAYTSVGGDILYIESRKVTSTSGKGRLLLTGSLGKVMQESAQTCLSFILAHADELGLSQKEIEESDIHLHFPDGATPKDGPSAGNAILTALVSLLKDKKVESSFAMTGEITLRGQVLPVGGIKEKLLAAHRYGKRKIIIPWNNWLDLDDLPKEVTKDLSIYPVKDMMDVLKITKLIKGKTIKPSRYIKNSKQSKEMNISFS